MQYIYLCVYMYIYIFMYLYICTYIYMYLHMCVRACVRFAISPTAPSAELPRRLAAGRAGRRSMAETIALAVEHRTLLTWLFLQIGGPFCGALFIRALLNWRSLLVEMQFCGRNLGVLLGCPFNKSPVTADFADPHTGRSLSYGKRMGMGSYMRVDWPM